MNGTFSRCGAENTNSPGPCDPGPYEVELSDQITCDVRSTLVVGGLDNCVRPGQTCGRR